MDLYWLHLTEAIQCDHMVPPGLLRLQKRTARTGVQVTQHFVRYTRCKPGSAVTIQHRRVRSSIRIFASDGSVVLQPADTLPPAVQYWIVAESRGDGEPGARQEATTTLL